MKLLDLAPMFTSLRTQANPVSRFNIDSSRSKWVGGVFSLGRAAPPASRRSRRRGLPSGLFAPQHLLERHEHRDQDLFSNLSGLTALLRDLDLRSQPFNPSTRLLHVKAG